MNDASSDIAETTPCRKPVRLTMKPTANTIVSRLVPIRANSAALFSVIVGTLGAICKLGRAYWNCLLRGSVHSFLHGGPRNGLGLLRSRLANNSPTLARDLDDRLSTSSTELAFLRSSSALALRLTLPHSGPSLALCGGNPAACSNAKCAFCWSRPIFRRFWTPMAELGLNVSDGCVDLYCLRFISDQRHRQ